MISATYRYRGSGRINYRPLFISSNHRCAIIQLSIRIAQSPNTSSHAAQIRETETRRVLTKLQGRYVSRLAAAPPPLSLSRGKYFIPLFRVVFVSREETGTSGGGCLPQVSFTARHCRGVCCCLRVV